VIDCYPAPYEPRTVAIDAPGIERLLGMHVPDVAVDRILTSLGFSVRTLGGWSAAAPDAATTIVQPGDGWQVEVPAWRPDVSRPVDVIEEIGRHHGYEHLPTTFPAVERPPRPSDPRVERDQRVRRGLLALGFSEAISFSFIESRAAAPFLDGEREVVLANPLSESFTTLRPSLLPGLVDAVSHNRRHGRRDVQLFEIGTRFSPRGEVRAAAAIWTGLATPDNWSGGRRDVDFFDAKGAVEHICRLLGVAPDIAAADSAWLVAGRAAEVRIGPTVVGRLGQLDPAVTTARDVPAGDAVYAFELDLDRLSAAAPSDTRLARPLPRHPFVVRDLSILVDDSLSAETVRGTMRTATVATLVDVREFDRYQGAGIPDGKVSLSFRLTFQAPDRTLTDAEVQRAMDAIVERLARECGAIQR
jgi:phenylalanyl-tRNA synthetase beta chain